MLTSKLISEIQIDKFNSDFSELYKEVDNKLSLIKKNNCNSKNLLHEVFEKFQLLKQILDLNKEILPQYILKVNQEKLNFLHTILVETKELLNPKKQFKFNKIKKSQVINNNKNEKFSNLNDNDINLATFGIKDKVLEKLELNKQDVYNKDIQLFNLVDCEIFIYGNPNTIHILNCLKCKIYTGPVITSILINGCNENVFQLFCQQLRVHNTKNCTFYLHVTTKAIIEDCSQLQFGKYNWKYDMLQEDIINSKLNNEINNWDKIIDFDSLSSNRKSLNWVALN